jgi:plasmid stabilization system protein ParE
VPSVVFSPTARAEVIEARDWYAARNAELADRFILEVENVVARDRRGAARLAANRPTLADSGRQISTSAPSSMT